MELVDDEHYQIMRVPNSTYHYKEIRGYNEYHYKLEKITTGKRTLFYAHHSIEKNCLTKSGLNKLQIFNEIYVPRCNSMSLNFRFHCQDGSIFDCEVTKQGKLKIITQYVEKVEDTTIDQRNILATSDLACSIHTIIHDYVQTSNGYFYHTGTSPLPCCTLFIPTWLSDNTIQNISRIWATEKMNIAMKESLAVIRFTSGMSTIRKIYHTVSSDSEKKEDKKLI